MYVKRNYGFWMTFNWSKKPFIYGAVYALIVTLLFEFTPFGFTLPWQPISVIGLAVAFYLGFKNNSSYDRTWEARKIWGGIVNNSRTFATAAITMIDGKIDADKPIHKELIYRHIAWLTALRYQLRLNREWEHQIDRLKDLYSPEICENYYERLDIELMQFIPKTEIEGYKKQANMATQILATQARRIAELANENKITDFRRVHLHELIGRLYDGQGASERIKNFPFPRQYASTALWITLVFCGLLPFGLLNVFEDHQGTGVWLTVLFCGLISWVFFLMEKIGDYSENPFEGSYNDVPISSISRAIEIDLRQMIGDEKVPEALKPENGFLM